jgi:hypothetical protein
MKFKSQFSESSVPIVATAMASPLKINFGYNSLNQQIGLYDYLNQNYKPISVPFTDTSSTTPLILINFIGLTAKNNCLPL